MIAARPAANDVEPNATIEPAVPPFNAFGCTTLDDAPIKPTAP